jgi:hypothetical protein
MGIKKWKKKPVPVKFFQSFITSLAPFSGTTSFWPDLIVPPSCQYVFPLTVLWRNTGVPRRPGGRSRLQFFDKGSVNCLTAFANATPNPAMNQILPAIGTGAEGEFYAFGFP